MEESEKKQECDSSQYYQDITDYCFDAQAMGEERRIRLEAHYLECDNCWAKVIGFQEVVDSLKNQSPEQVAIILKKAEDQFRLQGNLGTDGDPENN